ncbi:hypothetical protein MED121_04018 [Marinomonas sp. MED121]|nr:hypothetical protein MED121_04018 [Marinomonas sp. MED121]
MAATVFAGLTIFYSWLKEPKRMSKKSLKNTYKSLIKRH